MNNLRFVAVTRFNNNTWQENVNYRKKNELLGCCYGTPVMLPDNIPIGAIIYVLEMNNETNKIMGIGLIRNFNRCDKRYCIYSDGNYNRYNYSSNYRINRSELKKYNEIFLKNMEYLVFKGYTHMKRGYGIQLVTDKKYDELIYSKRKVLKIVRNMFIEKYN